MRVDEARRDQAVGGVQLLVAAGEKFGVVVLDPPRFAFSRTAMALNTSSSGMLSAMPGATLAAELAGVPSRNSSAPLR